MKIIHIQSYPRSGSTILGLALGMYQESYLGETPAFFTKNWDRNCACSTPTHLRVSDCPVWSPILKKSKVVIENYNFLDTENSCFLKEVSPHFLKISINQIKTKKTAAELKATLEILEILIHKASSVENAKISVGNYKDSDHFKILPYYFKLLYGKWSKDPKTETDKFISEVLGTTVNDSPLLNNCTFSIEPCHSFFENRSRKSIGKIEIKSEQAWETDWTENISSIPQLPQPFSKEICYPISN